MPEEGMTALLATITASSREFCAPQIGQQPA
jgi:hypothetical protein